MSATELGAPLREDIAAEQTQICGVCASNEIVTSVPATANLVRKSYSYNKTTTFLEDPQTSALKLLKPSTQQPTQQGWSNSPTALL
jgi:hypothetical protein